MFNFIASYDNRGGTIIDEVGKKSNWCKQRLAESTGGYRELDAESANVFVVDNLVGAWSTVYVRLGRLIQIITLSN